MGLQPTASHTDLLLQCQRPFDPATEIEPEGPSPEAEAAQVRHKSLHSALFGPPGVFPKHTLSSLKVLITWCKENNFQPVSGETHYRMYVAPKYEGVMSTEVEFDEETHRYNLHAGAPISYEMGLTPDLELESTAKGSSDSCVLDYKTGTKWDWKGMDPRTGQNMTLALRGAHTHVAILHTPEKGIPVVHWERVSQGELDDHRKKLRMALERISDGSMRMGPECKFCPARHDCPTQVGDLLQRVEGIVKKLLGNPEVLKHGDPGAVYPLLAPAKALIETTRGIIKERVEQGEVFETAKGLVLELTEVSREVIKSKQLTKDQREIMRRWGVLVTSKWMELRAK